MRIKTVFIDIDNTLLDFNLSAAQSIRMAFKDCGLTFTENVVSTFRQVNDGLWREIEKKKITREELHAVRFDMVFEKLGIVYDGRVIEKKFLENLNYCAVPVDGALDIVKYLSAKYTLCTATNAYYNQQIMRLTSAGILPYISKGFVSEKIGVSKPDVKFFTACLEGVAPIPASECVMIGDSVSADIDGAKKCGMHTVWFDHDGVGGDGGAEYAVRSLGEIESIL